MPRQARIAAPEEIYYITARGNNRHRVFLSTSKQPRRAKARSLLCYWAVQELGMTATSVAGKIGMTHSAVSRAVERGRELSEELDMEEIGKNTLIVWAPYPIHTILVSQQMTVPGIKLSGPTQLKLPRQPLQVGDRSIKKHSFSLPRPGSCRKG